MFIHPEHRLSLPHSQSHCTSSIDVPTHADAAAADDGTRDELQPLSAQLSDMRLASRKANEAAGRRFEAASWLQRMVGSLDLPMHPSEEELRLCLRNGIVLCNLINKIHPGAVPKIVENPTPSSPPPQGAALSAYQYFENVRNFLVAVEEMNLPSFEASDLEKGNLQTGASAKVVDCILSLKAYQERQHCGQGCWKFAGLGKSPSVPKASFKSFFGSSSLGPGRSLETLTSSNTGSHTCERYEIDGLNFLPEEFRSPHACTDPGAAWVQHVIGKFVDVFRANHKNSQDSCTFRMQDTPSSIDSMSSESLLKLVMVVLNNRQPEEVPVLVELMLRKVMEEFDRRILCQEEQLKRSEGRVMEDPSGPKGSSEEQAKVQSLKMELEQFKSIDQQHALRLESQNHELKNLKCSLETTKLEIQDAQLEWGKYMKILDVKLRGFAQIAAEYHKVVAENRALYNQVQDLKGNIRVYCRVRPFLHGQKSTSSTVDFVGEKGSLVIVNPTKQGKDQRKAFNFNQVFGPSATQEEVFLDTQPLIRSVLDGYNVCIFAYGQTGSGKTYTMTGPNNPSPKDWGVNFRALNDLFQLSKSRRDVIKYEVGVQMIEIYNEQVRDLLCIDGSNKKVEIRNSSHQNGVNVPDANMVHVESTEAVLELMTMGHKNRAVGATALNERSSRSHSALTVHVTGTDLASGDVLRGCLHLVDLAGSERVDKSEATGDRLKEAQHINKSLSALGDVIAALGQKSPHIPYRNSKLTQLLQDSLGGQAKTLMFVHISPEEDSYGETISTLKFAERVATVELGAAQNNKESGQVRDLRDQIAFLKDSLSKKDGELERLQKDARSKLVESVQDKSATKAGTPTNQVRRTSGDVVQEKGNRRQPLEEMRNVEVRSSPILGSAIKKRLSSSDFRPELSQLHSPTGHGIFYNSQEEDSIKRRAPKFPRQAVSPEKSSQSEFPTSTRCSNLSKNKIRPESSDAVESVSRSHGKLRTDRNFAVLSNACAMKSTEVDRTDDVGQPVFSQLGRGNGNVKQADRKKDSICVDETRTTCSEGAFQTRSKKSKKRCQNSQEDEDDVDEETSNYSEVNTWQNERDSSSRVADQAKADMLICKLRQSVDTRVSNQQTLGSAAKSETKKGSGAVGRRSRRYSLAGLPGRTTLEAKLIAISSEGGAVECYAKTTLPRQPAPSSCNSKSSKRWF